MRASCRVCVLRVYGRALVCVRAPYSPQQIQHQLDYTCIAAPPLLHPGAAAAMFPPRFNLHCTQENPTPLHCTVSDFERFMALSAEKIVKNHYAYIISCPRHVEQVSEMRPGIMHAYRYIARRRGGGKLRQDIMHAGILH
jgi:hypothetical protein